ncbi:hypothetical protein SDC9_111197 [bioreactor metagenome]|jgi:hypothetical protein|uniref:Uncharacterized protein n=1 Tax=bioreactor metagenome TaxID=1076179 RepID=A0A645BIB4_9ZZZZ
MVAGAGSETVVLVPAGAAVEAEYEIMIMSKVAKILGA